jgi:hypothetical protein
MKPSTEAVYNILKSNPQGLCRRDWAQRDFYEIHARFCELRAEGIVVSSEVCRKTGHFHKGRVHVYRLEYAETA